MNPILELSQLSKAYTLADQSSFSVLSNLHLNVYSGESVAILGQSGSGKSTLLGLLAGLDTPSSGSVQVQGQSLQHIAESDLAKFRAKHIGIVFQQFHLMNHLTALENVSLPLEILHESDVQARAEQVLQKVGLPHRMHHFPYQLSGGENQRVAIARALVSEPSIVLADEPTGSLDQNTSQSVEDILFDATQTSKSTLVLVTHDQELAKRCARQLHLRDGQLHEEGS